MHRDFTVPRVCVPMPPVSPWSCKNVFPLAHPTLSMDQAAGQKGKQTQQATVVDLFIRPQSSTPASAPPGQDLTHKHQSLAHIKKKKKKTQMEVHKLMAEVFFCFFLKLLAGKTCRSLAACRPAFKLQWYGSLRGLFRTHCVGLCSRRIYP